MKRIADYDEYGQGIPKNKPLASFESRSLRDPTYVTITEFEEMQADLKAQLEEQTTVLEQMLLELKQSKLHLASLSGEAIEAEDTDEN